MPLTFTLANLELYEQFRKWKAGAVDVSNSPTACPEIHRQDANKLRNNWNPNSKPNSWNQSLRCGSFTTKDSITKWVTFSMSGGKTVVDFHAYYRGYREYKFLHHFKVID